MCKCATFHDECSAISQSAGCITGVEAGSKPGSWAKVQGKDGPGIAGTGAITSQESFRFALSLSYFQAFETFGFGSS